MKPRFIVEQKITAFTNKYRVFGAKADGSKADLIAFAQQKKFAFKEKVTFYSDEAKQNPVFGFRAEKVIDIHGKYFVEDPSGAAIGMFQKDFKQSFLKSTWNILDSKGQPSLIVSESNQTLAVIRRYGSYVPILGEIVDIVAAFFKYHFVFKKPGSDQAQGAYIKTTLFRDHYLLSMDDETYQAHDWRVLAAMAVALDALQSR